MSDLLPVTEPVAASTIKATAPKRTPKPKPRENARARLLRAASAELIARDGALEIAPVAKRARAAIGLVYHYFGSRGGLLAAVADGFFDRWDAALVEPAEPPTGRRDFATREQARLDRLVRFVLKDPLAPVVLARLADQPEVAEVIARRSSADRQASAKAITQARARGELIAVGDPEFLVAFVAGGTHRALVEALRGERPTPKTLIEQLWRCTAAAYGVRQLSIL